MALCSMQDGIRPFQRSKGGGLGELLEEAEAAMFVRQQSLTHGSEAHAERTAINIALRTLKEFKRNVVLYDMISPAA